MSERRERDLPVGTVTFLFSDIEGSTRLLQADAADYPRLLETHAGLIREAIEGALPPLRSVRHLLVWSFATRPE